MYISLLFYTEKNNFAITMKLVVIVTTKFFLVIINFSNYSTLQQTKTYNNITKTYLTQQKSFCFYS